jgi:hypothetical protein
LPHPRDNAKRRPLHDAPQIKLNKDKYSGFFRGNKSRDRKMTRMARVAIRDVGSSDQSPTDSISGSDLDIALHVGLSSFLPTGVQANK